MRTAYLKTFVKNATGDLLSVFHSLAHAVDAQLNAVHESIGSDTVKTLVSFPKSFILLLGKVSSFSIKEAINQFKQILKLDPTKPCSQTLTKGIGIPCAHRILELLEDGSHLTPEDFHPQWHLRYNPKFVKTDEPELDLDAEMKKITLSLGHEEPEQLATIINQIHQIVAGTNTMSRQIPKVGHP
ncbi:hypothetical protein PTTG_26073 [Puccinia triticina 1-1 BBBD Race 1]|uniref:Uncharacterized protein n=1 Tax=Puccinia triticina (isolate 1-1 / race 1 (BBBD)) TaxID=630390 RepID=A0A180GZ16_PUCT1|nr:hypothetical protein PTTG_26073 [Puccinia triticina 1-1 BBBD Race 1]